MIGVFGTLLPLFLVTGAAFVVLVQLYLSNRLDKDTATIIGAAITAFSAVFVFAYKVVMDESIRAATARRKRFDLAVALLAEIRSNLQRQRQSLRTRDITDYIETKMTAPASQPASGNGSSSPRTVLVTDKGNVIFDKAIENYEYIPSMAMLPVVTYYNLDGMLTEVSKVIGSESFDGLEPDRKQRLMRSYLEIAETTDRAAFDADVALRAFIERHEAHLGEELNVPPTPSGTPFRLNALSGRFPWLKSDPASSEKPPM